MKSHWKVTHDPLRLATACNAIAHLEDAAREQGEDIIQAEFLCANGKRKILDLGWYRDRYLVILTEEDWSSPLSKIEARDLDGAMRVFRELSE